MLTLIIDSATKRLYFGLVEDNKVLDEVYFEGKNDHARHIVSGIEELLSKHNKDIVDVNEIICGVGPGSYTGVRMAVTVAKMFAHFGNIRLRTISTLALMGSAANEDVLVMIDARRGNVFGAIVKNGDFIVDEAFISLEELSKYPHSSVISEDNYVVDPLNVIRVAHLVDEPLLLVPNYLRDTEAERNLC